MKKQLPSNLIRYTSGSTKFHYVGVGLVSLLVGMIGVYVWQHHQVNNLTQEVSNYKTALVKDSRRSLDNLRAEVSLPNVVIDTSSSPADLIAFLGANNTQCYKNSMKGYFKIIKVFKDRAAQIQYGCTSSSAATRLGSDAEIFAVKTNNTWRLVSPTNQWSSINGVDTPSCTMVNTNHIPSQLVATCWEGHLSTSSGPANNLTIVKNTNQP